MSETSLSAADSIDHDLSGEEDPKILYNVIGSNSLKNAFKNGKLVTIIQPWKHKNGYCNVYTVFF